MHAICLPKTASAIWRDADVARAVLSCVAGGEEQCQKEGEGNSGLHDFVLCFVGVDSVVGGVLMSVC